MEPDPKFHRVRLALVQSLDGIPDALDAPVIAQDLHDGVQIGGVGLSGNSYTDDGRDVRHSAGEGGGICLIGLHVGGEAHGHGQRLDLFEPGVGIVGVVISRQEALQSLDDGLLGKLLVKHRASIYSS